MITLQCTKCKTTLTMDAAFAGGVCRCQHCGTIQTVPSRLRENRSGSVPQTSGSSRSRSTSHERHVAPGSGLDELGEIIASSGLSSSRLRQARQPRTTSSSADGEAAPLSTGRPRLIPLVVGAAVAVLLVVVMAVWVFLGNGGGDRIVVHTPGAADASITGPRFADLPLTGNTIIYVLDRGDGSREAFGEIKEATYASIASLGEDRRFQIVFWDNGNERAYPVAGTLAGGPQAVPAARQALEDIYAFGLSQIRPALRKAMTAHPDELVIVTAKGYLLDDEFITTVKNAVGNSTVKVHTVMVGSEDLAGPLPVVAEAHGGQFRAISAGQLREFARSSGL